MAETQDSARNTVELTDAQTDNEIDVRFEAAGDQVLAAVEAGDLSLTVALDADVDLDTVEDLTFEAVRELEHLFAVRGEN